MTITINGDLILDERAGLQNPGSGESNDDDLAFSTFQTQLNATLYAHLFTAAGGTGLNLTTPATGAFPQVGWQSGLISLSSGVDDLRFVSSATGTLFPTSGTSFDSGWADAAGNEIYLVSDSANHVLLGKTSAGTVDFAIVLDDAVTAGKVTAANLYLVQFAPIHQADATHTDDGDVVNLLDKVFVSSTNTVTTLFSNFSAAPSGQDVWVAIQPTTAGVTNPDILVTGVGAADTVNVSTTGLGTNSQAIDQNESLRIDFVNNAPTTLTSALVHNAANISYTDHAHGTGGGFSPVQTNPAKTTVSATIHAYNTTVDDQGAAFKTNADIHQTSVDIGSLRVYSGTTLLFDSATSANGTNGISVNLSAGDQAVVDGLKADYRVDFTAAGQMDRFTVQNTSAQANRAFDVGGVYLTNTATNVDNAQVGSHLMIEDDGPSIAALGTIPTLTVDETNLTINAATSFAGIFAPAGGVDGAASTTYALDAVAGDCGLVDTATHQHVVLSKNGGVVEGHTDGSSDLVFTVSVDSAGNVTLDQIRAVVQPVAGSTAAAYDDSTTLTAANLVTLTATVTDGDGDTAAATANIARNLVFKDDGPSIATTGAIPTLTVDDSTLGTNASGSFAGALTPQGGADGAASMIYALNVVAGDSGLVDTATKQHVLLSMNGAVAEGHTEGSNDLVFTVSVDSAGNVTLDQIRAVVQPIAGGTATAYDDSTTLSAANLVTLTATATDGDGDTVAATANIGQNLLFKDDGPSIATPTGGSLDFLANTTLSETLTANGGADGGTVTIGSYTLPTGLTASLSLDGQHLTYSNGAGALFTLDVGATGYTFTVLQNAPPNFIPLDFSGIPSGSPQETLTVPAVGTSSHIVFDGVDFSGLGAIGGTIGTSFGSFVNSLASTIDDLNPNAIGFGEKGGQASQMNQNEGFFAFAQGEQLRGLSFDIAGVGSVTKVEVEYWLTTGPSHTIVGHGLDPVTLSGGSAVSHEVISSSTAFDDVFVRFYYDTNTATSGVRVQNFATELPNVVPADTMSFTLLNTDGDGDTAGTSLWSITAQPI